MKIFDLNSRPEKILFADLTSSGSTFGCMRILVRCCCCHFFTLDLVNVTRAVMSSLSFCRLLADETGLWSSTYKKQIKGHYLISSAPKYGSTINYLQDHTVL